MMALCDLDRHVQIEGKFVNSLSLLGAGLVALHFQLPSFHFLVELSIAAIAHLAFADKPAALDVALIFRQMRRLQAMLNQKTEQRFLQVHATQHWSYFFVLDDIQKIVWVHAKLVQFLLDIKPTIIIHFGLEV